jgi:hypothetical protein
METHTHAWRAGCSVHSMENRKPHVGRGDAEHEGVERVWRRAGTGRAEWWWWCIDGVLLVSGAYACKIAALEEGDNDAKDDTSTDVEKKIRGVSRSRVRTEEMGIRAALSSGRRSVL